MSLSNCKKCGEIYRKVTDNPYCDKCSNQIEIQYKTIKEYLYKHPNSNAYKISEATGVPIEDILAYVRDGRFLQK